MIMCMIQCHRESTVMPIATRRCGILIRTYPMRIMCIGIEIFSERLDLWVAVHAAGATKIACDLSLFALFREVRPPKNKSDTPTQAAMRSLPLHRYAVQRVECHVDQQP
jgi:hypothetical protein